MAKSYSPKENIGYFLNPFDWSRGSGLGGKLESFYDPLNLFGGNKKGPANFLPMEEAPEYQQAYDPGLMAMTGDLEKRLAALQMDKRGLEQFRKEALRKGPSAWATLARQSQRAQEADSRERGAKEVRGQTAQALDELAARGGLSSGARERLNQEGMKNYLAMSQDLARQGDLNDMQIGINDETNRISQLSQLPGMELAALQPEMQKAQAWATARQNDIAAQVAENNRRNEWARMIYEQKNAALAAENQARATENSGKK